MKHLTFVYPYYDNPRMLAHQYEVWANYPEDLKALIDIVIVDDGSPRWPAYEVEFCGDLPRLRIFRVLIDKPWNQHGARNLGAQQAEGPWLFLSDMDHVLPQDSLQRLLMRKNKGRIYTFHRIDADTGLPTLRADGSRKPHPNSFAMTRDVYWRIGGYDEAFCGIYGTDGLFRRRAFAVARENHLSDVTLVRYPRTVIADASTTTLPRKEGRVEGAKKAIVAAKGDDMTPKTIQFPWDRVF